MKQSKRKRTEELLWVAMRNRIRNSIGDLTEAFQEHMRPYGIEWPRAASPSTAKERRD